MAKPGGVLIRAGHTEAGCDLAGIAGLEPASVICEIMNDDGTMSRLPELIEFATTHGLKIGAIRDLIEYRARTEKLVEKVSEKPSTPPRPLPPVRLQGQNLRRRAPGDGPWPHRPGGRNPGPRPRTRLGARLPRPRSGRHSFPVDTALARIAEHGHGVMVLLYSPQSGQDLLAQLNADTSAPKPAQKWDPRLFGIGAQILRELQVGQMRLMANPRKIPSMAGFGLTVVGHAAEA
jgi:3,4-dihydroxy 2-butanone 4-phosphate synthase/GTP cyclohydrolase II